MAETGRYYGDETDKNLIHIDGEDYYLLVDKETGTINIINQEWGLNYAGDRQVGYIKVNAAGDGYDAIKFNDENGYAIWLNARGSEIKTFSKASLVTQLIDRAKSMSINEYSGYTKEQKDQLVNPEEVIPTGRWNQKDSDSVTVEKDGTVSRTTDKEGENTGIFFTNKLGDQVEIFKTEDGEYYYIDSNMISAKSGNLDGRVYMDEGVVKALVEDGMVVNQDSEQVVIKDGEIIQTEKKISPEEIIESTGDMDAFLREIQASDGIKGDGLIDGSDRMEAYKQLIKDGPQGEEWDRYIAALKKLYPEELGDIERISDAELASMSYQEQWEIMERRGRFRIGDGNKIRGKTLDEFSLTQRVKVILADPCKNNFFSNLEAQLNNFLKRVTGGLGKVVNIASEIKNTANLLKDTAAGFIGQMGGFLQDKIQMFIKSGLSKMATFLFATSFTPIDGLLKVMALNVSAINPVGMIMNVLGCLTAKVGDALKGIVEDMLTNLVSNVVNAVTCAVEQFVGAMVNKITTIMDSIVGPFVKPIEMLFKLVGFGLGSITGILGKGFNMIAKLGNLLKCKSKKKTKCPPSSEYVINQGTAKDKSEKEQQGFMDNVFASASQKLVDTQVGISSFSDGVGDWKIFGSRVGDSANKQGKIVNDKYEKCDDSRNAFKCGMPKLEFIGGDGEGAVGEVIMGKVMKSFDTENVLSDIKSTASIIGVDIKYPGEGYTEAPLVSFRDSCEQGYGAYGRAIIDQNKLSPTYGQITDVVILSEGINYPMGDDQEVFVDKVIVEDGGRGYQEGDTIDDFQICGLDEDGAITDVCVNDKAYRDLPQLNIHSITGSGAVLRPIMTKERRKTTVQTEIDCVTT